MNAYILARALNNVDKTPNHTLHRYKCGVSVPIVNHRLEWIAARRACIYDTMEPYADNNYPRALAIERLLIDSMNASRGKLFQSSKARATSASPATKTYLCFTTNDERRS